MPESMSNKPGRYGLGDEDGEEELTKQTRLALSRLAEEDRRYLKMKLTARTEPPAAKKMVGSIAVSVVAAALFAVAGAAATIWRNDAVNAAEKQAMTHWIQGLDSDLREHNRSQMHVGAREAIARNQAQIDALRERIERIEHTLDDDGPRRR